VITIRRNESDGANVAASREWVLRAPPNRWIWAGAVDTAGGAAGGGARCQSFDPVTTGALSMTPLWKSLGTQLLVLVRRQTRSFVLFVAPDCVVSARLPRGLSIVTMAPNNKSSVESKDQTFETTFVPGHHLSWIVARYDSNRIPATWLRDRHRVQVLIDKVCPSEPTSEKSTVH
jgi:hypothetical protein